MITDFFDRLHDGSGGLGLNDTSDNRNAISQRCAHRVALDVWCRLHDFVHVVVHPPASWISNHVAADHPFIGVSGDRLALNLPPGVQLPTDVLG